MRSTLVGLALLAALPFLACSSDDTPSSPGATGADAGAPSDGSAATTDASTQADGATTPEPVDLGPVPAWREGMTKWQWLELTGTAFTSVPVADPFTGAMVAPTSRVDAWNGLAANLDTNRVYLACAGGHADWAGNETYELDLHTAHPTWKVLRGPTMAPDVLASNGSQGIFHDYYADGRPSSTHLYYALHFVRAKQSIFKLSAGSIWGTGNEGNSKVDAFDLTKNDWAAEGTYAEGPGGRTAAPLADRAYAHDPDTDDVYTYFAGAFRKWTAATATWSKLADRPAYANDDVVTGSASAVDPARKRVLFARNAYRVAQSEGIVYDVTGNAIAAATFTGAEAATMASGGAGMVFVPSEDAYLLTSGAGGKVVRVDPASFATSVVATTGATPPNAANGVYTRWLYLPKLEGIAYLPRGSANAWFLATR